MMTPRLWSVALLAALALPLSLTLAVPATSQTVTETHVRVHVQGAVRRPGVYSLLAGSRLAELVALAGGPRADADLKDLNLAHVLTDGELCQVPVRVAAPPPVTLRVVTRRATRKAEGRHVTAKAAATPVKPVNLNRATLAELDTLPGIGPGLAASILKLRSKQGRFATVEALREVPGIGPKRFERLKPLVRVN